MSVLSARSCGARGFILRATSILVLVALLVLPVSAVPFGAGEATAVGTMYWVDVAAGSDANPGTEAEPFKTLTKASSVVGGADTIMVQSGTYSEASGETFPLSFQGTSLLSVDGAATTIIQGNGINQIIGAQSFTEGDVISGFTFTGGKRAVVVYLNWATGPDSPRIEHNVFEGNDAGSLRGGGLALFTSGPGEHHPLVQDNIFRYNTTTGQGGALSISGAVAATIRHNEFTENSADDGGAIFALSDSVSVEIADNLFGGNEAHGSARGGAVFVSHSGTGEYGIFRNRFWSNIANDPAGYGGSLHLRGVDGLLSGNDFSNNFATQGGAGYLVDSVITAENNLILGGSSSGVAAAWYVDEAGLKETHSTVAENVAGTSIVGTPVPITYATPGSTLVIVNSIYWNEPNALEIGGADSLSYSCVRDSDIANPAKGNTVGAGVIFADPLFVDTSVRDARLSAGSPCIDTADTAQMTEFDYFGQIRPQDGDGDGVAKPDMGYHEYVMPVAEIQHDAAGVVFDRWVTGYSTAYSGGGYVYGRWTGTELTATFTGSKVRWVGPKQPLYGMADVYIDSVLVASNVDCYASDAEKTLSAVIWESGTLADGPHTLEIRLIGAKNAASGGYYVVLDRFEVDGIAPAGGGVRYDERDGVMTGSWLHYANATYYDKTYSYSRWTNATFSLTFEGTGISWIGPRTPNYGMADIYIDGIKVATVDQYRANLATQGWREVVWKSGTLTPGTHTLEIKPLGTKNPAATAANVVLDAIDVTP